MIHLLADPAPSVPNDWWGLVIVLIPALITAAVTITVTRVQTRRLRSDMHDQIGPVHEQIVNDHGRNPTNLRDDVDGAIRDIKQVLVRLARHDATLGDQLHRLDTKLDGIAQRTARIGDQVTTQGRDINRMEAEAAAARHRYEGVIARQHPDEAQPPD